MAKSIILILALALAVAAGDALAGPPVTGQTSVGTGADVAIGTAANGRVSLTIKNTDGTNPIYCGPSGVTSSTGLEIAAGEAFTFDAVFPGGINLAREAVHCRATGGTVTAAWWESVR
jgi:hypothetical protein